MARKLLSVVLAALLCSLALCASEPEQPSIMEKLYDKITGHEHEPAKRAADQADEARQKAAEAAGSAREAAGQREGDLGVGGPSVLESLQEKASRVYDRLAGNAEEGGDRVRQGVEDAYERAKRSSHATAQWAGESAEHYADRLKRMVEDLGDKTSDTAKQLKRGTAETYDAYATRLRLLYDRLTAEGYYKGHELKRRAGETADEFATRSKQAAEDLKRRTGETAESYATRLRELYDKATGAAKDTATGAKDTAADIGRRAGETWDAYATRLSDMYHSVTGGAEEAIKGTGRRAGESASDFADRMKNAMERLRGGAYSAKDWSEEALRDAKQRTGESAEDYANRISSMYRWMVDSAVSAWSDGKGKVGDAVEAGKTKTSEAADTVRGAGERMKDSVTGAATGAGEWVTGMKERATIKAVGAVDHSKLAGRWYQLFETAAASYMGGGTDCNTADIGLMPNGSLAILMAGTKNGKLAQQHGYLYTPSDAKGQGEFKLHLFSQVSPVDWPWLVAAVGPKSYGTRFLYEWVVFSDTLGTSLRVFVRDVARFNSRHRQQVLDTLRDLGFTWSWNRPFEIKQLAGCRYLPPPTGVYSTAGAQQAVPIEL